MDNIQEWEYSLKISEEDQQKGELMAQQHIREMVQKLSVGEISAGVFCGYLWALKDCCWELIEEIAEGDS